jgi:hypothetical protein
MPEAVPRSSGALRDELRALDTDILALDGKLSTADCKIKFHALNARRGSPDAVKSIIDSEALKRSIASEMSHAAAARAELLREIEVAVEREAQEARQAISDEAVRFAGEVEPLGRVLDETVTRFKDIYSDLKRRLHQAEQRGYGPSGSVVQSALTQALRASLWRIAELAIEAPHVGLGRSFGSLTVSWSGAAEGAAKRLAPPATAPVPKPNGHSNPAGRVVDLSAPLPGDDPTFVAYGDRNEANAALAAASRGPN